MKRRRWKFVSWNRKVKVMCNLRVSNMRIKQKIFKNNGNKIQKVSTKNGDMNIKNCKLFIKKWQPHVHRNKGYGNNVVIKC